MNTDLEVFGKTPGSRKSFLQQLGDHFYLPSI